MSLEDQDILAKIGQVAGQINRHKNSQATTPHPQLAPSVMSGNRGSMVPRKPTRTHTTDGSEGYPPARRGWQSSRGAYSSRGHARGGGQQVHRNRTLVLNGSTTPEIMNANNAALNANAVSTQGWVTKTDRHLQLINTSIYEKECLIRAKAMEESRKLKLKQREEREKSKLNKYLQRSNAGVGVGKGSSRSTDTGGNYEIVVSGIQFRVAKNGSKLVKVPGDLNAAKATPKTALVGGVKFHRSKNGNMFRAGIIRAHGYDRSFLLREGARNPDTANHFNDRKAGVVKTINEPCKTFTTTGSCSNGLSCRYMHEPTKVAVCRDFLQKGSCPSGDSCDLSHDLVPERTPTCLHFAKGNCSNPACRYSHVRVSSSAPVCRAFGIYGYCEKGLTCEERHVYECPDFSNTGKCNAKGCKLPHRLKASTMRTNTALAEEGNSDISSDEDDEEIDSDDVDSDDLDEEFFGESRMADTDIPMQQDFVHLS